VHRCQGTGNRIINYQGNVVPVKEQGKAAVTDLREMEFYKLPDQKFTIISLK
jgi:hypothetical protein